MDDKRIIALYENRDQRAITETAHKYGAYCRAIAMDILAAPEDAEECVNDTWMAAWQSIPPQVPVTLRTFLGRITRNLSISRYRANHAGKRYQGMELLLSELEECIPAPTGVEEAMDERQLSLLISDWLESLRGDERTVFVRRYWYGDGVKNLASVWGCSPNAMSQRLSRLREELKKYLEQEGVYL